MQPVVVPRYPRLRGEKAVRFLQDFINELEEQRGEELTEKQTTALIKFAKGLISSIEAETHSDKAIKEMRLESRLKKAIVQHISESVNRLLGR